MAEEIDSLEQGERARKWMQRNGSSIVIGVLAAVAILMGYEAWKSRKAQHQAQAGDQYVELNTALQGNETERAQALVGALTDNYADTPYAALAQLEAADVALAAGKPEDALAAMQQAVKLAPSTVLADTARLRLARLQQAQQQADAARKTLDAIRSPGFTAQVAELRGDLLLAAGKRSEARDAYTQALAGMDVAAPGRSTLQNKIDDLSGG